MSKFPLAGCIALLLAAAPARAQVLDNLPLETRALLAALAAAEEAADAYERALDPAEGDAPDAARRLRQVALEGTVEAARADLLLETFAALRAQAGAEAPLPPEEAELRGLLATLQRYGFDLVAVEGCEAGAPPLDFAAVHGQARPTLDRIRTLGDLIERRIQTELGRPEERP